MFIIRKKSDRKEYLYHIQNMNICTDGNPYDVFLWCDHVPTTEDLKKVFLDDFGGTDGILLVDEFVSSSDVWKVCVHDSSVLRKKEIEVDFVESES